jgi:hypothetical protein
VKSKYHLLIIVADLNRPETTKERLSLTKTIINRLTKNYSQNIMLQQQNNFNNNLNNHNNKKPIKLIAFIVQMAESTCQDRHIIFSEEWTQI